MVRRMRRNLTSACDNQGLRYGKGTSCKMLGELEKKEKIFEGIMRIFVYNGSLLQNPICIRKIDKYVTGIILGCFTKR